MKSTALNIVPGNASLRKNAEQRLRTMPAPRKPASVKNLRSALEELHIYEAELEIQNEDLLESRAQIEDSQQRYFRHFDLAPVGLLRLDRKGLILEANILAAQMLDEKRVLLNTVPRTFIAHVVAESAAIFQQHLESALTSGKMEACEISLRSKSGAESFVRLQTVMNESEGDPDFYMTLTDLTERREIEQKLELQKVMAEAAVSSKQLLFGMLSHELRTPLTPLVALLEEMGADRRRSAEDLAAFEIMRRNLDLEIHLIDDLLDLTRMTGGKLLLRREITDAHIFLERAIGICQEEIQAKGIHLTRDLRASKHLVHGDSGRLQQVFWNLIKNAVKFTPTGGRIAVTTRSTDASQLVIEVSDTGVGIDAWSLGRMFDPFFQAGLSLNQRSAGLGLGLAICKAITEAHGGTLTAMSDGLGKGTVLRVQLATSVAASLEAHTSVNAPVSVRLDNVRLLLVEDHDDTREVLMRLLRRRGYEVSSARTALEARACAMEKTFDLLVSDIALPDASGCDLAAELTAKYGLPAIAMSGFGSDADIAQSKEAGFLEHLVKPIDAKVLDRAIQRLVARA